MNTAKNTFLGFVCMLFALLAKGQLPSTEHIANQYHNKQYSEIIAEIPEKLTNLEAKALYYIGMAYYMKEQDANAMKYLDMAIAKGPVDHDMFFYKGRLYFYAGNYTDAMPLFDKAIALLPDEPDFYIAKAEVYTKTGRTKLAIDFYEKAIPLEYCDPNAYDALAELYQKQGNDSAALRVFETCFAKLKPDNEYYSVFSFNVGLFRASTGDSLGAKALFENHVALFPEDYKAMAKLIQAYYALEEFDKAIPYKQTLYKAYKAHKMPSGMEKMFCFAQFKWNGRKVLAFEHFAELEDEGEELGMFVKHAFFILKENGDIDFKIESESSVAVRMTEGDKYVLCKVVNGTHSTYWDYVFNDNYKYPDLKKAVLKILNKNVTPAAQFIPGTGDKNKNNQPAQGRRRR